MSVGPRVADAPRPEADRAGEDIACDVLVVGGGPAGSTVATLLARRGWRVLLLEKAHHPRFHIGESLLPMNLPLFERLGVLEKVHAIGVHKPGADFESDEPGGYNTFHFDRALGASPPHAYQVLREAFDQMLFEHARAGGVDAREGVEVLDISHAGSREAFAQLRDEHGRGSRAQARYVVDASGRDALLASRRKLRRRNVEHQSAAIFGHFRGAATRSGKDAGNISLYHFEHGWMWMIPLPDGVMSVGAVCRPDYLKRRRGRTREFFLDTLKLKPDVWARVEGAALLGEVRVAGNYAYDARRMGGPGWLLIGDAFAFLDPVFSSGVYLAMSGAERAADLVDAALRDPASERRLQRNLEKRLRRGMRRLAFFIYRFNSPVMKRLFRSPRNVWQVEQGVISMLAGDVFDTPRVLRRLLAFRVIYALAALCDLRAWRAERTLRLRQARSEDEMH